MLITHDLGVVAEMVEHVIVMYSGQVVEQGTVNEVLIEPRAPYTMGLLESIPTVSKRGGRLSAIKGTVPSPFNLPPALPVRAALPVPLGALPREAARAVQDRRSGPVRPVPDAHAGGGGTLGRCPGQAPSCPERHAFGGLSDRSQRRPPGRRPRGRRRRR